MNPYETMFVVANKEARKSHDYLEEHIRELIGKVGGKVVRLDKWDERQLAYQIDGQKEGIFYLGFVEAEGSAIADLKRETELSELILRMLVLRKDRVPDPEEVDRQSGRAPAEEETPAASAEKESSEAPASPAAGKTDAANKTDAAGKTDAAAKAEPAAEGDDSKKAEKAEAPAAEGAAPAESTGSDS